MTIVDQMGLTQTYMKHYTEKEQNTRISQAHMEHPAG